MSLAARISALTIAVANLIKGRQPLSTVLTDLSGRTIGAGQTNSILDRSTGDSRYSQTKAGAIVIRMENEVSGGLILTGSKGYFKIPYAHTLSGWTFLTDQNTTAVLDLKKATNIALFPTTSTITGASKPSLTAARKNNSSALSGWTVAGTSTDIYEVNLDSNSAAQSGTFVLEFTKL